MIQINMLLESYIILVQSDLLNSMIIQVMLSAPSPSEAARFIGHILSIIISIILDKFVDNGCEDDPLSGDFDPFLVGLLDPLLDAVVVLFLEAEDIGIDCFFEAEDNGNPPSFAIFALYS